MKILYVVTNPLEINSSASLRNISTIEGLLLLGHSVTVITAKPSTSHPNYSRINISDEKLQQMYISSSASKTISAQFSKSRILNRIRVAIYKYKTRNNIYDSWSGTAKNFNLQQIGSNDYDLMISSSDPKSSHLLGEKIYDQYPIKWVQIWGDPFSGDITSQIKGEERRKVEEKRFFSKANKIYFLSPLTTEDMKEKYSEYKEKMFFMPRPYINPIYTEKDNNDGNVIKLSYCGDYNNKVRNILPLYDAINSSDYKLTIVGNSDFELEETSKVTVYKRMPKEFIDQVEREADILIHLSNSSGSQIPGKIYNYSATNKPILFILDGESSRIEKHFKKYDRYYFCRNETKDIITTLQEISNKIFQIEFLPVEQFSYKIVINDILS